MNDEPDVGATIEGACATSDSPRDGVAKGRRQPSHRKKLLRSGTSVGAHGREAFRARSNAELVSKLEVAIQELDESLYWIELLIETNAVDARRLSPLIAEANELMSILVASARTIKRRRRALKNGER